MKAKVVKQVVITESKSFGNSFGDRTFNVVVEYRENGVALESKRFIETAHEGSHDDVRKLMTGEINQWAKQRGTAFTGAV